MTLPLNMFETNIISGSLHSSRVYGVSTPLHLFFALRAPIDHVLDLGFVRRAAGGVAHRKPCLGKRDPLRLRQNGGAEACQYLIGIILQSSISDTVFTLLTTYRNV